MKAVCIIASSNVVIDGDVIFINREKSSMECPIYCDWTHNNVRFTGKGLFFANTFSSELKPKLMILWFWHLVVLRKSHVYLVGVNK